MSVKLIGRGRRGEFIVNQDAVFMQKLEAVQGHSFLAPHLKQLKGCGQFGNRNF